MLVLTDIFGATPSNVAAKLLRPGKVEGIAGVNLPMLIRALTYREEPLEVAREKALLGRIRGRDAHGRAVIRRAVKVTNKLGLHARASAKLTQLASRFQSSIWIERNGRRVNAKSIMGVMMLAAGLGSTVELETDGADEQVAIDEIEALFNDKFGEGE